MYFIDFAEWMFSSLFFKEKILYLTYQSKASLFNKIGNPILDLEIYLFLSI